MIGALGSMGSIVDRYVVYWVIKYYDSKVSRSKLCGGGTG